MTHKEESCGLFNLLNYITKLKSLQAYFLIAWSLCYLFFLSLWPNIWQKWLRGERIYFSSWFQKFCP
jgi:hypothetical protein